ncbi:MAG: hypothetical protein K0R60_715, partial [Microbacterium sp.]|nr:hypothetical protein [Microbacterium sp.]
GGVGADAETSLEASGSGAIGASVDAASSAGAAAGTPRSGVAATAADSVSVDGSTAAGSGSVDGSTGTDGFAAGFRGAAGFLVVAGRFGAGFFAAAVLAAPAGVRPPVRAGVRGARGAGFFTGAAGVDSTSGAGGAPASDVAGSTLRALDSTAESSDGGTSEPGVESITGPRYQPRPGASATRPARVTVCHEKATNTALSTDRARDPVLSQDSWIPWGRHKGVSRR